MLKVFFMIGGAFPQIVLLLPLSQHLEVLLGELLLADEGEGVEHLLLFRGEDE